MKTMLGNLVQHFKDSLTGTDGIFGVKKIYEKRNEWRKYFCEVSLSSSSGNSKVCVCVFSWIVKTSSFHNT